MKRAFLLLVLMSCTPLQAAWTGVTDYLSPDVNLDWVVNETDLLILHSQWHKTIPIKTVTPIPSMTSSPTRTPFPSNTPQPTRTPTPTMTPTPDVTETPRPDSIYHVSPLGNDSTGDGSAQKPFQSLNKAAHVAFGTAEANSIIRAASGRYQESITLRAHVTLEGGYNPNTWQALPPAYKTIILRGQPVDRCITCSTATIRAVTIRDGIADIGGGIGSLDAASLLIEDCTFDRNRAFTRGGGIYTEGRLILRNCTLTGNSVDITETAPTEQEAARGGGVYCGDDSVLESNVFSRNRVVGTNVLSASACGGGVFVNGDASFMNNYLTRNGISSRRLSVYGAGVFVAGDAFLSDNVFDRNGLEATNQNGYGGAVCAIGDVQMTRNELTGNTLTAGRGDGFGSAVCVFGPAVFTDDVFQNNQLTALAKSGSCGGAIYCATNAVLNGNLVTGNKAEANSENSASLIRGGGVFTDGDLSLWDCTISGNTVNAIVALGGGIYCSGVLEATRLSLLNNQMLSEWKGEPLYGLVHRLSGAGLYAHSAASLQDCLAIGNVSLIKPRKGGIFRSVAGADGGGAFIVGWLTLSDVTFNRNRNLMQITGTGPSKGSVSSSRGGGLFAVQSGCITDCTFEYNTCRADAPDDPERIAYGGGFYGPANTSILRTIFRGNSVRAEDSRTRPIIPSAFAGKAKGGGVYMTAGSTAPATSCDPLLAGIFGNVMINNTMLAEESWGGGLYADAADGLNLVNNTLVDATGTSALAFKGDAKLTNNLITSSTAVPVYLADADSNPILVHNLIHGSSSTILRSPSRVWDVTAINALPGNTGNLDAAPLVASPTDYHLLANSPAIDAGTQVIGLDRDIDGQARPMGDGFDIGADEYVSPATGGKPGMLLKR